MLEDANDGHSLSTTHGTRVTNTTNLTQDSSTRPTSSELFSPTPTPSPPPAMPQPTPGNWGPRLARGGGSFRGSPWIGVEAAAGRCPNGCEGVLGGPDNVWCGVCGIGT